MIKFNNRDKLIYYGTGKAIYFGAKISHKGKLVLPSIIETKNDGWFKQTHGRFYQYTDDDMDIPE